MTSEERRAYIRQVVDAAPPLTPEDATLLRAFIPLGARLTAERTAGTRLQHRAARAAAA